MFVFGAAWALGLVVLRKRSRKRQQQHILQNKVINLGRYFGLDVGGTLAKLVYFRRTDQLEVGERILVSWIER